MDDMLAAPTGSTPVPPQPPPQAAPAPPRAPGRPAADPERRAQADERYAQMQKFRDKLPAQARELRVAIFPAQAGAERKAATRPITRVLFSTWEDRGLDDEGALASYLEEELGPGRYLLEPQDEHNRRIDKLPSWVVSTSDEDQGALMEYDDLPPQRGRRRRFGDPRASRMAIDDYDEGAEIDTSGDPYEERTAMADVLTMQARGIQEEHRDSKRSTENMMQAMMLMQQQQREAERDERRREEERAERRRQEEREERKLEEERRRREEERAREEERREWEARLEERRREDERLREERRREDEARQARESKRLELMVAALPIVQKFFEPKTDPVAQALLSKVTEPEQKGSDPMQMLLLKHVLDKNSNDDSLKQMMSTMGEVNRMGSSMMTEQLKSILQMNQEMTQEQIQQARKAGGDDDDKGIVGQVLEGLQGASELVNTFTGGGQAAQPPMAPPPQQPYQQPTQQAPAAQQPTPAAGPAPSPEEPEIPTGAAAVIGVLVTISQQAYPDEDTYQRLVAYMITEMPPDLRRAVMAGDEQQIYQICGPIITSEPELKQWIQQPGMVEWIRSFLQAQIPLIKQVMEAEGAPPPTDQDYQEGPEGDEPEPDQQTEPEQPEEPALTGPGAEQDADAGGADDDPDSPV